MRLEHGGRMRSFLVTSALGAVCMIGACAGREEVVEVRGGLYGIPGAKGGYEVDRPNPRSGGTFESILGDEEEIAEATDLGGSGQDRDSPGYLRTEDEDGEVVLISRSPQHLFYHLNNTLMSDEYELLYEQLISDKTKEAYRARGRDPREALEWLKRNEKPVRELLAAMPMGQATPGVLQETIGRNQFRFRSKDAFITGLPYDTIDVIIEDRSFKLLLIH